MANPTLPVYDKDDSDLRRRVIEQIQAMSSGGVAPSIRDYKDWWETTPNDLPSISWLKPNWGWVNLIEQAGLRQKQARRRIFPTMALGEPLREWEVNACQKRAQLERGW